jgi:hypothetical protein
MFGALKFTFSGWGPRRVDQGGVGVDPRAGRLVAEQERGWRRSLTPSASPNSFVPGSGSGDGVETRATRSDGRVQGNLLLLVVTMAATSSAPWPPRAPRRRGLSSPRGSASIHGRARVAPPPISDGTATRVRRAHRWRGLQALRE